MPTGRLTMRRIRDVLRLRFAQGLSERAIAASLGLGKGSVGTYLRRARDAGLAWPLPEGLDDDSLELLLFPNASDVSDPDRQVPDWAAVDKELRRRSVTRMLLWQECRAQHPNGFGYTWFCTHFEAWKGRVRPSMRQTHVGGEKVFVDFAGDTIDIIDPATGEISEVKLFVAAMGASSYTYAVAVASEGLEDWIAAHVGMLAYLGGVPQVVVPDNLKSAVIKADRYDPGLNRTYAEMAEHYGTAILPARVRKPKDKAKVEVAVQVAQRWILARLRNHRFFSLAELNAAIRPLLDALNMRVMRDYGASRADLFATLDRPNLQPLPTEPYVFARWKRARVAPDYHIEVDRCWYSVPFSLIRQVVDARITHRTVEIFHRGTRVASHLRDPGRRSHITAPEHMPSAHRRYAEWSPARILSSAAKLGPSVAAFCDIVMQDRPHPEQGFRTCLGILSLARSFEPQRLDAACRRGISIKARSVVSIRSILKTGIDQAFMEPEPDELPLQHPNIRRTKGAPPVYASACGAMPEILPLKRRRPLLTHPTCNRLEEIGLTGMAQALHEQRRAGAMFESLSFEERLGLLVDREAAERDAKRLATRLRFAALRHAACVEDIDMRSPRGIDAAIMAHLIDGGWINRHENLLITGPTGLGKSWIACALGNKACRDDRRVVYHRVPRLFQMLAIARGDGRHARVLKAIERTELLILDDWGLSVLSQTERRDLLEILDDRQGRGSTIVTSQLPVDQWFEVIGDPTLADAILDRLVHNAHRLTLTGDSMRRKMSTMKTLDHGVAP